MAGPEAPAKQPVYGVGAQLSEDEKRRSEAAVQQRFGGAQGVVNVGARLMAKMGFGSAEGSKGGLGRNEHVR